MSNTESYTYVARAVISLVTPTGSFKPEAFRTHSHHFNTRNEAIRELIATLEKEIK